MKLVLLAAIASVFVSTAAPALAAGGFEQPYAVQAPRAGVQARVDKIARGLALGNSAGKPVAGADAKGRPTAQFPLDYGWVTTRAKFTPSGTVKPKKGIVAVDSMAGSMNGRVAKVAAGLNLGDHMGHGNDGTQFFSRGSIVTSADGKHVAKVQTDNGDIPGNVAKAAGKAGSGAFLSQHEDGGVTTYVFQRARFVRVHASGRVLKLDPNQQP